MWSLIRKATLVTLAALAGLMLAAHSVESRESSPPVPVGSSVSQDMPPEPSEAPAPGPVERGQR